MIRFWWIALLSASISGSIATAALMLIPALLLFGLCQDALEQGIALPGGKD